MSCHGLIYWQILQDTCTPGFTFPVLFTIIMLPIVPKYYMPVGGLCNEIVRAQSQGPCPIFLPTGQVEDHSGSLV